MFSGFSLTIGSENVFEDHMRGIAHTRSYEAVLFVRLLYISKSDPRLDVFVECIFSKVGPIFRMKEITLNLVLIELSDQSNYES